MHLLPWTTRSLALVGDDLYITQVVGGPLSVREQRIAIVPGFAAMHAAEARAALLAHQPPRNSRLCVLVPADMVSARRMPLGCAAWSRASGELRGSVEKLLPIEAEHAVLGMVDRAHDATAGQSAGGEERHSASASTDSVGHGYLLGTDARTLRHLLEPIEAAFGRPVDLVLAWPHALLGLGTQREPRALVLDESPPGVPVHHELRSGRLARLSDPGHSIGHAPAAALLMPGVQAPNLNAERVRRLDGYDLAAAAALAEHVAPGAIIPLRGRRRSIGTRWIAAAAAAMLGLVLLLGANRIHDSRVDAELIRIQAAADQLAPELAQAEARRERLTRLTATLAQINDAWSGTDPQIIEAYRALRDAVPAQGFIYRVQIDGQRMTMNAEAPRAAAVLERVEGSPLFRGATMRPPSGVSERPGMERFEITAERLRPSASAATGEGARR